MKKLDLERMLHKKGARRISQDGKHDKWESKNGYPFSVPRHKEIVEWTARQILKQADM